MTRNVEKMQQLELDIHNLGFPHDDCERLTENTPEFVWFRADFSTFSSMIWSLSAVEKLLTKPKDELEKYHDWLKKSFFDHFPKYEKLRSELESGTFPHLSKSLELNERSRQLILKIVEENASDQADI
jgi:hypothetical protein